MNCAQALARLLEADVAELSGDADSAFSRHVASCERCRARADTILAGQRELANALNEHRSRVPVERALAAARQRVRSRRRMRTLSWVVPLAAAAGISVMMVSSDRSRRSSDFSTPVAEERSVTFDLGIATDQTVAVFESATRPNVVVVWFY